MPSPVDMTITELAKPPSHRSAACRGFLICLLVVQTAMIAAMAWRKSATNDEIAHIPAAVCYWQFQRFELYRVNPPLARFAAGLPVLLMGCATDWSSFDPEPGHRREWNVGYDFIRVNHERYRQLLFVSRLGLLPFLWVGTVVVWTWARELGGNWAAFVAATLWVFDPNVLGNGALVTCDVPASSMGALAVWRFWHWLKRPSFTESYFAGMCCGLALLTKTVWIVLPPLWTAVWLLSLTIRQNANPIRASALQAAFCGITALFTLNAGYGFEGTLKRLGDFQFISHSLGGQEKRWHYGADYGNRFADTLLARIPVPLPESFVQGIDEQRYDFESESGGYLAGEHRDSGFWYYYLYGLLVKVPVSALVLLGGSGLIAGAWVAVSAKRKSAKRLMQTIADLMVPAMHGTCILILVSCQPGLNSYFRYLLPAFPFAMLVVSVILGRVFRLYHFVRPIVIVCIIGFALESIAVFPHSLSFFNIAAGGPATGGRHMLGSNLDWGQDLGELERWIAANPQAAPLRLIHTNFCPIELYQIPHVRPEFCDSNVQFLSSYRPEAGWYAISVNYLYSTKPVRVRVGSDTPVTTGQFQNYFRAQPLRGMAGYSYHIFHVPD